MITHQQAKQRVKLGFVIHLAVYVAVVAGLMALNFTRNPEKLWSVWVALGWGGGVVLHGLSVIVNEKSRERIIQRKLARMERRAHSQPLAKRGTGEIECLDETATTSDRC